MLRAWSAANALHEKHFRRVRRDVEPLIAGLAENVSAHTGARFEVETTGVTICALSCVERAHNAAYGPGDPAEYPRSKRKYHPDRCTAKDDKRKKRKPNE
jgi:hypothetical protein